MTLVTKLQVVPKPSLQIKTVLGTKGEKGDLGDTGPANALTIGAVIGGDVAEATILGEAPNQVLHLVLPKGDPGPDLADGDKGDITVSSAGTVWTIDNNAVTLAKMADIATSSLLGRVTAASGDPEVLTVTQAQNLLKQGEALIESGSISAVGTHEIPLPAGYKGYRLRIRRLRSAGSAQYPLLQFKVAGAWVTGASAHTWTHAYVSMSSGATAGGWNSSAALIGYAICLLSSTMDTTNAIYTMQGDVDIYLPIGGVTQTLVRGKFGYLAPGGSILTDLHGQLGTTGTPEVLRIIMNSTGTIANLDYDLIGYL